MWVLWDSWCTCHLVSGHRKSDLMGVLSCFSPKSSTCITILKEVSFPIVSQLWCVLGCTSWDCWCSGCWLYIGIFQLCMLMATNTLHHGCNSVFILSDLRYPLRFLAAVLVMCNMVFIVSICIAFPSSLRHFLRCFRSKIANVSVCLFILAPAADTHYLLQFIQFHGTPQAVAGHIQWVVGSDTGSDQPIFHCCWCSAYHIS